MSFVIHLNPRVLKVQVRLGIADSYLKALGKSLPRAKKAAIKELKSTAEADSWPEGEYFEGLNQIDHEFEEIPFVAGSAFVAFLQSVVDEGLSMVCAEVQERERLLLKHTDLRGSVVERSKTYLTKVAAVETGDDPCWPILMDLSRLRNLILHQGAQVEGLREIEKQVGRIKRKYPGQLSVQDDLLFGTVEVRVSLALCGLLLAETQAFFNRLFRAAMLEGLGVKQPEAD